MILSFTPTAWNDYLYWQEFDPKMSLRIQQLIKDCLRSPFSGIGRPEGLKHSLAGCWSRRIDLEHRLVYKLIDNNGEKNLLILSCRYHYV